MNTETGKDDDDAIIMLIPVFIGEEDDSVTPGSAKIKADCGHECWISPSSLRMIQSKQHASYTTRCGGCLTPEDIKGMAKAQLAPEGAAELGVTNGQHRLNMLLMVLTNGMQEWHEQIRTRMIKKGLIEA